MATFINIRTTEVGQALLAQVHAGSEELTITGIAFGSGAWTEADHAAMNMTTLNNEVLRVAPSGGAQSGGEAELTCVLTNEALETGFALTELGVIAEKKDGSEVLYMADCVPPVQSTWISAKDEYRVEIPVSLRIACCSSSTVEIRISSTVPVTNEDLDRHNTAGDAHSDIREALQNHAHAWLTITGKPAVFPPKPHSHTPNEVGLNNVPNAISDSVTEANSKQLATSAAAKTAYDKGKQALDLAGQKAPANHDHHGVYYTQAQVNELVCKATLGFLPAGTPLSFYCEPNELPEHWYFRNGELVDKTSPAGMRLLAISATYKLRHNITETETHISLPNAFDDNGDGYFDRPVDGVNRLVGSMQGDAIRNITGRVGGAVTGYFGDPTGCCTKYSPPDPHPYAGTGSATVSGIKIDLSRSVPTSHENRPVNYGSTPAVFLPPLEA